MKPLILKLKKASHREIAGAQDLIVEELYNFFNDAVLHGGTAIWRCYGGNRFSEDIDAYLSRDVQKLNFLFENLKKKGFEIEKKKIGKNSLYSSLRLNRQMVRFEAVFRKAEGFLKEYETVEGNLITVYTLTPDSLIKEKIAAYLQRLKVRDLYDIFFLLRHVEDKNLVSNELRKLIAGFKHPVDKEELKVLVLEGLVPDVEKMVQYIKHFVA